MFLARARSLAVLTSGVLLAAALTGGPAQAGASGNPATAPSGMTAVAGGTVTGATGAAMGNQTVDLYAWPPDAVLKAMKPGQTVPTTLLATATTNRTGKYMLMVPTTKLKTEAVESGYANLEISSVAGGFWFFAYQTASLPAHPSAPVTVNLGAGKKPACGGPVNGTPLINNGFTLQRELPAAWAVIGQGYIVRGKKTAGDKVTFSYNRTMTTGETTTLGMGISAYGVSAGYNTSGSSVVTTTKGIGYPKESNNTWFRTKFSVGQYRAECYLLLIRLPFRAKNSTASAPRLTRTLQGIRTKSISAFGWPRTQAGSVQ